MDSPPNDRYQNIQILVAKLFTYIQGPSQGLTLLAG